ncbi:MAG: hypothetical protein J0L88_05310 [Xanthomonadales bacterium]|nr:hypothetical protein [Xanthomonadales bacterium]
MRQTRPDKHGRIDAATPRILATPGLSETAWSHQVLGIERRHARAVGSVQSLLDKAAAMGQRWLKGVVQARRLQRIGAERFPDRVAHAARLLTRAVLMTIP